MVDVATYTDADLDRLADVLTIRSAAPTDWRLDALYRRLLDDGDTVEVAMRRWQVYERLGWGLSLPEIAVRLSAGLRTVERDVAALAGLGDWLRDLIHGSGIEELMAA